MAMTMMARIGFSSSRVAYQQLVPYARDRNVCDVVFRIAHKPCALMFARSFLVGERCVDINEVKACLTSVKPLLQSFGDHTERTVVQRVHPFCPALHNRFRNKGHTPIPAPQADAA